MKEEAQQVFQAFFLFRITQSFSDQFPLLVCSKTLEHFNENWASTASFKKFVVFTKTTMSKCAYNSIDLNSPLSLGTLYMLYVFVVSEFSFLPRK